MDDLFGVTALAKQKAANTEPTVPDHVVVKNTHGVATRVEDVHKV